ncbi:MAG TPA: hypothetical protein VNW46_19110 [Gemmatimonadaceae bacterium]|nr:hypothetical protein [Gemmatimonadaceae bacterium]
MKLQTLDRALGGLLIVGSLLHALGSIKAYASEPTTLVWALSATMAGLLLGTINLVRASRRHDQALAWISIVGCVAWVVQALAFGVSIGSPLDPRVLIHAVNAVALAVLAARSLRVPQQVA